MDRKLHDYRKSYEKGILNLDSVSLYPMEQFGDWFNEAEKSESANEVNAMTLSTVGSDGFPRGRIVLLKEYTSEGFIFYTNYGSEKGAAIEFNNKVCISFFWPALERQVIVKGVAIKVSEEKSTDYHSKRPRKSQLGALVSNQSESIENRETLEKRLKELEATYGGVDIPKPTNWGGYLIEPSEFEFWQGRRSRLHDRIQYLFVDGEWKRTRLQP